MASMAKITIMSYISTYSAIGSAWILALANYFLIGWFNGYLDYYCEGIDDVCRIAGRGEGREVQRGRLEDRDTFVEDSL
jgi:hypothetical protein